MQLFIKDIGLTAFTLLQHGTELISYDQARKGFLVSSETDYSIMYMNSESRRHDSLVLHLKHLILNKEN